ncbi:hypothetical protein [Frankia sp. Cj3]|uniref:hypothetical protein n=1 Tax=Frankia sp. Cj3 TaxID=2880976 RepID=UPI001EF6E08F|nr:hypothetical protein [Frankia sp. Cj3]
MTVASASRNPVSVTWLVDAADPFLSADRLPRAVDPDSVSRFGDGRWDLAPLNTNRHYSPGHLNRDRFPEPLRPSFRRAGWALVNLPTPEALLERFATNRVRWLHPATMVVVALGWHQFARWLTGQGTARLSDVTGDDLEQYAVHVAAGRLSRKVAADRLGAVSLLWAFAPHLPDRDRIPLPPWDTTSLRDYLPAGGGSNDNSTPPIHPAVMSPLLIWAMRFVNDFAEDILNGWQERQSLVSRVRQHANPQATAPLRQLIATHVAENRPLPGSLYLGRLFVARTYLAGCLDASEGQVQRAVADHGAGLPVSTDTPLQTPVRGQLHGRPWIAHLNFNDVPVLMHKLATASMIVVLYLSGMRPGEALELQVGCCPEPADDGTGPVRYEIHGNVFKGARDPDGRPVVGGVPRDTPWVVIPPVARAIRVVERTVEGHDLFPVNVAWAKPTRGNRKRPREVLSCRAANDRITSFIAWVNDFSDRNHLTAERIPDDPDGPLVVTRFRRTIAWHIARLPGGRIALAIQYGHLRTSPITDGYAGRGRQGLRRVLDIETARAMADYLDDVAGRLDRGEAVSGPAAGRLMTAAAQARARFEGMFLTPKQTKAFLAAPQFHVYDNPDAFLTCNYDPAKALCHPERTRPASRTRPPAIDRCDPACANIARTDTHIANLREEIRRHVGEVDEPATPSPLRERLRQRTTALQAIVDRHEQNRTVLTQERRR